MNESFIKQQRLNLLRLANNYSQRDLDMVMAQNPNLSYFGLELPSSQDYAFNRNELKKSLKAFQLCCAFLSLCKKSKTVNVKITNNNYLKHRVEHFMKTPIPAGSIVAAADLIGIMYNSDVAKTPYVALYIKKDLPITQEMEFAS